MTWMPGSHSTPPPYPPVAPAMLRGAPPRLPKPPLTRGQRRGALIAGGISFVLIGGGCTVLVVYGGAALATLLFAGTWQLALGAADEFGETTAIVVSTFATSAVIFIVACGLGYAASYAILRLGKAHRPHLTTLLGSGIAVTAWSAVAGIFVILYLTAATPEHVWDDGPVLQNQILGIVVLTLAFITGVGVGALSWWLAAHLLRMQAPGLPAGSPRADGQARTVQRYGSPASAPYS